MEEEDEILNQLNSQQPSEEDDPILAQLNQQSGEGNTANFTNASSGQSEGGGTTASPQESSAQQETGGTIPAKPSLFTDQKLPVGVASQKQLEKQEVDKKVDDIMSKPYGKLPPLVKVEQNPYDDLRENLVNRFQETLQQEVQTQITPVQQRIYDTLVDQATPLINKERQDIQERINEGQITEEEGQLEYKNFIDNFNAITQKRAAQHPEVTSAYRAIQQPLLKSLNDDIAATSKMEYVSDQNALQVQRDLEVDKLSNFENFGRFVTNELIKTKMIPAQVVQMASQVTEELESGEAKPVFVYKDGKVSIEDMTPAELQKLNLDVVEGMRKELEPTKGIIDSYENGDWGGVLSSATGNAVSFLGSIIRGVATGGISTGGEIMEPMWAEAVYAKAQQEGKTVEEILAQDAEDELTSMGLGVAATALEYAGIKGAGKMLKSKLPTLTKVPKTFTTGTAATATKETATELGQGYLENLNKNLQEQGTSIASKDGAKKAVEQITEYFSSPEAAETAASTFLGSFILGKTAGAAGTLVTLADAARPSKERVADLDDAQIKEILENPDKYKSQLNELYSNGFITDKQRDEANLIVDSLKNTEDSLDPQNPAKSESVKLINERARKQEQLEKLDETQRGRVQLEIDEINNRLEQLANGTQQEQTEQTQERTVRDRQQQPTQEEAQGSEVSEETQRGEGEQQAELPTEDGTRGEEDVQGTEVEPQTQDTDAVQEQSTTEVDVRQQAETSEEVGGQVRGEQELTQQEEVEGEATQEEVDTPTPEAKQRAEEFGYTAPIQAVRIVNDRLNKDYNTIEEISDEELQEARVTREEQKKVEADINEKIEQNKSKDEIISELSADYGRGTVENVYERVVSKDETKDESYRKMKEAFDKARKKQEPPKVNTKNFNRKMYEALTDMQYGVKKAFKDINRPDVVDRIITTQGSSGRAKFIRDEAYDKIYRGISRKEQDNLDEIIQARRISTIDQNRRERGLPDISHPNFTNKERADKFLETLKKELGEKKFEKLNKKADEYFNTFRDLLDRMQKSGLVSKETRDQLYELDYQPRKFLKHLLDAEGELDKGKLRSVASGTGLSERQIKRLGEGSANELVLDSEWLLSSAINQRERAIATNDLIKKINQAYNEATPEQLEYLKDKLIDNPVIGYTKSGNPRYKYNTPPKGFSTIYFYEDGEQRRMFLEDSLYDSLMKEKADWLINPKQRAAVSNLTGGSILRALATGYNPFFVLGNLPNDFGFTVMFEPAYSSVLPKAIAQVTSDISKAWVNIHNKDEVYQDFVMHGGMMDFMYQMGKLDDRSKLRTSIRKAANNVVEKAGLDGKKGVELMGSVVEAASYMNQQSELGFRLGIYKRVLGDEMKQIDKTNYASPEEKEAAIEDAKYKAAARARQIMDFNQGGYVVKALDTAMPYLNAATQASYTALVRTKEHPISVSLKAVQAAGIFSMATYGVSAALFAFYGDDEEDPLEEMLSAYDKVSDYNKRRYFIVMTPFKDENGDYTYYKVKKTQTLTPIFSVSDHFVENEIREIAGVTKKASSDMYKNVVESLNNDIDPINFSELPKIPERVPILSAAITYQTGYDYFRDKPVSYDVGNVPKEIEGYYDVDMPEFYKKLSDELGLSPARTKTAVEKIITTPSTDPYVALLYAFAESAVSENAPKAVENFKDELVSGSFKRIGGKTSKYVESFERREDLKEKIEQVQKKDLKEKKLIRNLADQYHKGEITDKEALAEIKKQLESVDPEDRKTLIKRFKDRLKIKDAEPIFLDIKYEKNPQVQALLFADKYGVDLDDKELNEVVKNLKKLDMNLSKEFIIEYQRLREGENPELSKGFVK